MASLSQLYELASNIDPQNRTAIIALIDIKAEEQMEAVTSKLDTILTRIDSLEKVVDERFKSIDSKFDSIEKRLGFLQWSMMVGFSAIALVVTVLKLTS